MGGMFLSEGGISIEILYNYSVPIKNRYICDVSPYLSCLSVKNACSGFDCKKKHRPFIDVDIANFKETMTGVKIDILKKCNDALKSKTAFESHEGRASSSIQ